MDIIPLNHPIGKIQNEIWNISECYHSGLLHPSEYRDQLRTILSMVNRRLDSISDDELRRWEQRPNQI
jgi:hypothetical protein